MLAIATLEPRKNLPHLVSAFGALAATHPDLRLVIAGRDGPARPAVDDAIARLPAAARDRVVLAGHVDDAGRRALLDAASVLAYPSIYEGFGFPLLEAMSAGRARRRGARRLDSRGRRRRGAARRTDRRRRARRARSTGCSTTTPTRADLIARGRDRLGDVLVGRRPHARSPRATGSSRSAADEPGAGDAR